MATKKKTKKIVKIPSWLHVLGFFLAILVMFVINVNGFFALWFGGIIVLYFIFKFSSDSYKLAIKQKKNPISAYYFSEFIIIFSLYIFMILISSELNWDTKGVLIFSFLLLIFLIWGIKIISDKISKKSIGSGISFMVIMSVIFISLFSWALYSVPKENIDSIADLSHDYLPIQTNSIPNYDINIYENEEYGISINYPSNWEERIKDKYNSEYGKTLVFFMSPLTSQYDFQENINLDIQFYPEELTEEITNRDLADLKDVLSDSIGYATIIQTDYIKFDNYKGIRMVYTYDAPTKGAPIKIKGSTIVIPTKSRAYSIIYTATTENYLEYEPILQDMINSLKINS